MGLGEILGSLSPGFGLLSGKGIFGGGSGGGLNGLAGSGLFGLLGLLLHHGDHTPSTTPPTAAPGTLPGTNLPTPSPVASMGGPSVGQVASQMPGMANKPNPFAMLGSAMQSNTAPDPGVQLGGLPQQSNGLQALLQQILSQ